MAGIDDIKDHHSLLAWLANRSQADIAALANRAALRGLPGLDRKNDQIPPDEARLITLRVLRAALTSWVAVKFATYDLQNAVHSARRASYDAFSSAVRDADDYPEFARDCADEARYAAARAADSSYLEKNPNAAEEAREAAERAAEDAVDARRAKSARSTFEHADSFSESFKSAADAIFDEDSKSAARLAAFNMPPAKDITAWTQIRNDITAVLQGKDLFTLPLWHSGAPGWRANAAPEMRAIWPDDPPGQWAFWRRWWDGVLDGQPLDWELQKEVALIPDKVWERGGDGLNGRIGEIVAKFAAKKNAAQAEGLLHAALADFNFDTIARVLRMVPFEDEIRHLRDPDRLVAFLDDADSIRDDLELFSRALSREGQMQGAGFISTYLDAVLDEFSRARQLSQLRVGRIVELGKILEDHANSPEIEREFGPAASALKSHVQSLLSLTRRHFAATLTRMAPLQDLSSAPDDDQWTLLQDIQRGIRTIGSPNDAGLPPLAAEDQAVLQSLCDSIERLLRQANVVQSPQSKSSLRREVDFRLALLSVSIALFLERGFATQGKAGKVLDTIATTEKRVAGLVWFWKQIEKLFE